MCRIVKLETSCQHSGELSGQELAVVGGYVSELAYWFGPSSQSDWNPVKSNESGQTRVVLLGAMSIRQMPTSQHRAGRLETSTKGFFSGVSKPKRDQTPRSVVEYMPNMDELTI
jgi:hypothetical protein